MNDQTARVAVVTGAAQGIGAAIAKRLAADGHPVAVLDLDAGRCQPVVDEIRAAGGAAEAVQADVADEDSVAAAVAHVESALGPPLILVNNAGILRDNLVFRMSTSEWDQVLDVHLRGAFLMSRAVQSSMVAATWGRIVNLSSTSALGNRGQANYSAAKAGIQGLTKTLAIELGRYGVTVNAIAPGFIATDMTRAAASSLKMDFEEFKAQGAARIPVGRVGTPEDVAATTAFFVRDDASFVSGQVVYVAGGPRT